MISGGFFKKIRILLLLFILFIVGVDTYLTKIRSTDWDLPLRVVVYPVNGDGRKVTQDYIDQLQVDAFSEIEVFMNEEASQYKLPLSQPASIKIAHQVSEPPPAPPKDKNVLQVMWWSLTLRYWSFKVDEYDGPTPNVRIYVVYHDPAQNERLAHSLGLEKGMIGVVNGFASHDMQEKNNIVITHEFLHTVGASDKYNLSNGQPIFPIGYVEPDKTPRYPQEFAEIMAGAIPISNSNSQMPEGLYETVIGPESAKEINWIK